MHARHRLRKPDQRLKLANCVPIAVGGGLTASKSRSLVRLPQTLVLFLEDDCGVLGEGRSESAAHLDVGLKLLSVVVGLEGFLLETVHAHNMLGDLVVFIVLFFVADNEKEVEAAHDRSCDLHVVVQRARAIVAAMNGICRSQDRSPCIKSSMDSRLRNGDSLLLHCLVDGRLVVRVHLVEFINAADSMVCQHQCSRFDAELSCFPVLANTSSQTGC